MPLTISNEVSERITKMTEHCHTVRRYTSGWGHLGSVVVNKESETLLHVLSFAVRSDELWLDGDYGLGGRINGLYFGVVPHKQSLPEELLEVFVNADLSAFDWGVHS